MTDNIYNAPLPSNAYGTITVTFIVAVFSILSCGYIGYKLWLDYNYIRFTCLVMGVMTIVLSIVNVLRIPSWVLEAPFFMFQAILLILFADLLILLTFNLGSKFYDRYTRFNKKFKFSVVTVILGNLVQIVSLVLTTPYGLVQASGITNTISEILLVISVFCSYWYAFSPVVKQRIGDDGIPSSVAALGVWHLAGMGILALLHMVPIFVNVAYPGHAHKEININVVSVAILLRMTLLVFYCTRPSASIMLAIRKRLSRNPSTSSIERSTRNNGPMTKQELDKLTAKDLTSNASDNNV